MATITGRNASVKKNSVVIDNLNNWEINIASDPIIFDKFGTAWSTAHGLAVNNWSGSFDGAFDKDDTAGQVALRTAQLDETLLTDCTFHMNDANYYETSVSGSGLYITGHVVTATQGDVNKISYTFQGTGELTLVTA